MSKEIVQIGYVCEFCGRRRILKADKKLLDSEISNPFGNGLCEVIDYHICKDNKINFFTLSIDSSYTVRTQSKIEFFGNKYRKYVSSSIPDLNIPMPQLNEDNERKRAQIPDWYFGENNTKDYYFVYKDKQTGVNLLVNTDNIPATIRNIVSHDGSILISYPKGDNVFENWVDELMAVNEISHPNNVKIVLYQLLYIKEKVSKNLPPTAHDNEILVLIAMMNHAKIKINCENNSLDNYREKVFEVISPDEPELIEFMFDKACDKYKKLTELLSEYERQVTVSKFFECVVKLSHSSIISLDIS